MVNLMVVLKEKSVTNISKIQNHKHLYRIDTTPKAMAKHLSPQQHKNITSV